jgi:hypothetical protein
MIEGSANVDARLCAAVTPNFVIGMIILPAVASVKISKLAVIRLNSGIKADVPAAACQNGAQKVISKIS